MSVDEILAKQQINFNANEIKAISNLAVRIEQEVCVRAARNLLHMTFIAARHRQSRAIETQVRSETHTDIFRRPGRDDWASPCRVDRRGERASHQF
jgi:hypothetical protein